MVPEAAFAPASISQPRSSSLRCFRAGLLLRPQFRPYNHHCNNCLAGLPASNPQSCPHTLLGAAPSVWPRRPWTAPSAPVAPSPLQDASVPWGGAPRAGGTGSIAAPARGAASGPALLRAQGPADRGLCPSVPGQACSLVPPSFLPSLLSSPPATPALPAQGSLTLHESLASPKSPSSHRPVSSLLLALMQAPAPIPLTHSSANGHPNPRESALLEKGRVPPLLPAEHSPSLPGPLPQPCSALPLPLASSGRSTPSHGSDHHLPQRAGSDQASPRGSE